MKPIKATRLYFVETNKLVYFHHELFGSLGWGIVSYMHVLSSGTLESPDEETVLHFLHKPNEFKTKLFSIYDVRVL